MIAVRCGHCGSEFHVFPYKLRNSRGKFCSRRCMHAARPIQAMPYRQSAISRYEHRRVAEMVLGKALPPKACVHHVNEDTRDNRPSNLVICQDAAYHKLIHLRMRVLRAGGNPNAQRPCYACKQLVPIEQWANGICRPCSNKHRKASYHKTKGETRKYVRKVAASA